MEERIRMGLTKKYRKLISRGGATGRELDKYT